MSSSRIRLSTPDMSGEELKYVQEAFKTNWIAPVGPNISNFEGDLEDYLGNDVKVAALSSGTAAIHLALVLVGVSKDDEVLCQSMTFAASVYPVLYQGATPIFIDSEKESWNMDPVFLEKAIKDRISYGKKPKAIIVVHVFGMPAKIKDIVAIAKKYDILLIEDAAEALGSEYDNQKCGTFGDYGIFSFNGNKIITTSGGGALIVKNEEEKNRAIHLATQAKDIAPYYQHSEIGFNYRLSNVLAGIGRGQMEVLNAHVLKRRSTQEFYKDLFQPFDYISVFSECSHKAYSNHWLSCIIISDNKNGKHVLGVQKFLEQNNIESRPLWKPMHLQPVFKDTKFYGEQIAENLFKYGLCLPSGSNLTETNKQDIAKVVLEYLGD